AHVLASGGLDLLGGGRRLQPAQDGDVAAHGPPSYPVLGSIGVRIADDERRARLGRRHRLADAAKAADVVDVARDLVGLHATDPATVYLAAAARMKVPSIAA